MTLTRGKTVGKYVSRLRGLLYTVLRPIVEPRNGIKSSGESGRTVLDLKITFCDGSVLTGIETLVEGRDCVEAIRYGYEYHRPSGFFFFYELETLSNPLRKTGLERLATQIKKPRCHLHVGAKKEYADKFADFPPSLREHDGPHYGTYPVSLDYVLAVIIANYFPERKGLIKKLELGEFSN